MSANSNRVAAYILASLFGVGLMTTAQATCGKLPTQSARIVNDGFVNNPPSLLTVFPIGGPSMASTVRTLLGQYVEGPSIVLSTVTDANRRQREAIGEGFAYAITECHVSDPSVAKRLVNAVAKVSDSSVLQAFRRVTASDGVTPVTNQSTGRSKMDALDPGAGLSIDPNDRTYSLDLSDPFEINPAR